MNVRYTPEAVSDLEAIQSYIRNRLRNPGAAKRITKAILTACGRLAQFPNAGMLFREKTGFESDLRVLFCENYLAVYRVEGQTVSVARILDARQDYCALLFGESKGEP